MSWKPDNEDFYANLANWYLAVTVTAEYTYPYRCNSRIPFKVTVQPHLPRLLQYGNGTVQKIFCTILLRTVFSWGMKLRYGIFLKVRNHRTVVYNPLNVQEHP